MTSRYKKAGYTAAAVLGLFVGAAGIAAAATGGTDPAPAPPASQTDEANDSRVNCEDGIDSATGNECDGGPAAAQADEATEAPDNEAEEADDSGVNCEDGIDTATGNECDGGPAAAQADEATEAPDNEAEASADASGFAAPQAAGATETETSADASGTAAPQAAGATETEADEVGDEADDGIDHQFEGEEVGENGNGVADADDANETQEQDD